MSEGVTKTYPNIAQSFGICGIVVLGMIVLHPLNSVLNNILDKEVSMFIYYLLSVGLSFALVYAIRRKITGSNSFQLTINYRIIPFIVAGTVALLFGIVSPIATLIPMPESVKSAFRELGSQTGFFAFVTMVIAAPILEELIFRGIILDGLLKKYSPLKSILFSSFLFGMVHLNPWQLIAGLLIGIFCGWVYYRTRSLLPCIIIHFAANLSGFSVRYFIDIEAHMDDTIFEMYGGTANLIAVIFVSIMVIGACIYALNKEFEKDDLNNRIAQPQV